VHFSIAVFYKEIVGIHIESDPGRDTWDGLWQTLPLESLKTNMVHSVWNLHAQPPLYNMYGAFFIKLFYPHHLQYMHYSNIILGSLLSAILYSILVQLTRDKLLSFLVALLLALNPSLFLYEAYILYTLLAAFLVVLSVFFLSLFSSKKRPVYIYAFVLSLNLLILTRSVYHVIILFIGISIACILAGGQWKKTLVVSVIISLLSIGWYGKNYAKFGFFGGSSWGGLGIWKVASAYYTGEELEALVKENVIQDIVLDVGVFHRPSSYIMYGFSKESDIDVLSRDDYNNINVIDISRMYRRNALYLILHNPLRYLGNVLKAYAHYTRPSSRLMHLAINAGRMQSHEAISSEVIQGHALAPLLSKYDFGPFIFFLLPVSMVFYFIIPIRTCGISASKWFDYIRADTVLFFAALLILYTTIVSCVFEYGENDRFRFLVEQLIWAFIIGVAYRYSFWKSTC
jgi:hypothetical protein